MKVQITQPNVFFNGQRVPVNTVIDVSDIGPTLANKCRPVVDEREQRLEVATPEPQPLGPLDALRSEADALGVAVDKRWGESRLRLEIGRAGAGEDG